MQNPDFSWEGRLLAGENIVWSGMPAPGVLFTGRDIFMVPLSLLWCGFAIFWESKAIALHAPILFRLWGIPFVLAGLYFTGGRFAVDALVRRRTHYAVTSERVLIERAWPSRHFTAINLDRLPEISLSERAGGRGTIVFGAGSSLFGQRNNFGSWTPSLDPTPQFMAIEGVRSVFDKIQKAAPKRARLQ